MYYFLHFLSVCSIGLDYSDVIVERTHIIVMSVTRTQCIKLPRSCRMFLLVFVKEWEVHMDSIGDN